MKRMIICDLDGTLANIDHRLKYIQGDSPDWDTFYSKCPDDTPNEWCVDLLFAMKMAGCDIIIVTARRKSTEDETLQWLSKIFMPPLPELVILRDDGNHKPDYILKKRWLETINKKDVLFVIEDRNSVVNMWREQGLVCLQCQDWDSKKNG